MNDMRITGRQLFWMIATMQIGMTILLTINPAIQTARRDAWISTCLAGLIGVSIAYMCSRLSSDYPNQTFVHFTKELFGKWLGHAVIFVYFAFWYSTLAIILRQYSELIIGTILPRTPIIVPVVGMLLVAMYVTRSGLGAIARCSEFFGPIVLFVIVVPILLGIKEADLTNFAPVFVDSGWMTVIQGSLPTATFLGDCVMLIMLIAFLPHPKKSSKSAVLGVGAAAAVTCLATFLIIAVFGYNTSVGQIYPYFKLVRYVSYFDFVQNLDSLLIAIWIISVFIKVSLYFFISVYGTAEWFGIGKWRRMTWIVAPIAVILALIPRNYLEGSIFFPQKIAIPFILPIHMVGLPLLMWGAAALKKLRPFH